MDPVAVAWAASGRPQPQDAGESGRCARCLTTAALTPVGWVVSNKFTGITDWADPRGLGLCPACTWGYRTTALRRQMLLVDRTHARLTELEPAQLYALLRATEPLGAHLAVSLPLTVGTGLRGRHVDPCSESSPQIRCPD